MRNSLVSLEIREEWDLLDYLGALDNNTDVDERVDLLEEMFQKFSIAELEKLGYLTLQRVEYLH